MLIVFVCFSELIMVFNTFHENIEGERQSEKLFLCNVEFAVMGRGVWRGNLLWPHLIFEFDPASFCRICC